MRLIQEAEVKPGSSISPPPGTLRKPHRQRLSQVLWQEQNILPEGSQSWQQVGQERPSWHLAPHTSTLSRLPMHWGHQLACERGPPPLTPSPELPLEDRVDAL